MGVRHGVSDIETRADCERLVRAFYGRALEDPIIGFIFTDVAKLDLEAHVPRITSFWETILLGAQSYGGGAFRPARGAAREGRGCAAGTSSGGSALWRDRSTSCSPASAPSWPRRTRSGWPGVPRPPADAPVAGVGPATGGLTVTQHGR